MKKLVLVLLIAHSSWLTAFSQYWQQQVNFTIDVSLNDKNHTLDGFEKVEYINHSPDTLKFIWFHLWANAYKNDKTAFSDQELENGSTKFYFSDKEQKGYINRLDFKVNGITAQVEDHPQHIDIVKLILPIPLAPGEKTIITTPFHVKLPYNFSRGGHDGESYQLTQWYPKPAVYDSKGWHPMPYLDQGEFYGEFGDYDVTISLPKNYVVAATGALQNEDEKKWLRSRSSFNWEPLKTKEKIKGAGMKTTVQLFPPSSKESKTIGYKQNDIHDFAWFADKRFIVNYDTCRLASGKVIDVFTYYTPAQKKTWANSVQFCKQAVRHYSGLVGEYPYPVVSAVQGPQSFGGGMEYPTITIISPGGSEKEIDLTIAHEVGHNWFYGILATNERDHPWMDEGINTYYDNKYAVARYGPRLQLERILFEAKAAGKTDQPIMTPSEKFSMVNYELVAYYKTGEWMRYLESFAGPEAFNKAMQDYYRQWQFRHPQPEDFKKAIAESSGKDPDPVFSYLKKKGTLPNLERKGSKALFYLQPKGIKSYLLSPSRDLFVFGPAIGFNSYDKFMIGALLTNMKLPASRLQFLLAPLYATGAKRLSGLGFLNYSFYSDDKAIHKTELFLNASTFSYDEFLKLNGEKKRFSFSKLSTGIRLTAKQKTPRSTVHKFIQLKTYFIFEETYGNIKYDTIINMTDTIIRQIVPLQNNDRYLNQFKLVIENFRALYPYKAEWKLEQGKDFLRMDITGKYFFNYSKEGGLDVRLFAGKFFYTGSKTSSKEFSTSRYHLNMTGANGIEDYTYRDYFVGRNKFKGLASQQIMNNEGCFKIRTDLYSNKIGNTDDWLVAANLTTSIPRGLNPLDLLPIHIPLKVFVDIGTYAEAWKPNAETDRFLFDAGLQIPLFKELINIYVPLIYSDVYKNYIQSTLPKKGRLWHTISFSIDISGMSLRKIDRNLDF